MIARRSLNDCLQLAASGALARKASRARSIALSTLCHSGAALGFNPASASSHCVSRSLMRVLAPARSPLSTSAAVSATIARKDERSPSFDDIAASAGVTMETATNGPKQAGPARALNALKAKISFGFFMDCLLVD